MSKSMNMLRTRRRDNNVKPNRRLDRKSSRGMIYENEELRLKTININAEVERGQSDNKKLRRKVEMLQKELWYMRDEYEKLHKLLKQKEADFTSSSSTCSSDSEASMSEDPKEVETSQNLENVQKTNLKNLQVEFDHLSVVPEEPSTENSDKSRTSVHEADVDNPIDVILQPDQSYPGFPMTKHFFAPLPSRPMTPPRVQHFYTFRATSAAAQGNDLPTSNFGSQSNLLDSPQPGPSQTITSHKSLDLLVKTDNRPFSAVNHLDMGVSHFGSIGKLDPMQMLEVERFESQRYPKEALFPQGDLRYTHSYPRSSTGFSDGGNVEELLNDIQTLSEDILKISNPGLNHSGLQIEEINPGPFQNGSIGPEIEHMGHYPLEKSSFNANVQSLDRLTGGPSDGRCQEGNPQSSSGSMDKFKSEISVVLMPTPMPLIGFEKYQNLSSDRINNYPHQEPLPINKFDLSNSSDGLTSDCEHFRKSVDELNKLTEDLRKEQEKEEAAGSGEGSQASKDDSKSDKMTIRRKVSIHFKGRRSEKDKKEKKEDSGDSKNGTRKLRAPGLTISSTPSSPTPEIPTEGLSQTPTSGLTQSLPLRADTPCINTNLPSAANSPNHNLKDSSDSEHPTTNPKHNKSTSASPERQDPNKKHHKPKKKKKSSGMGNYLRSRRNTLSTDQIATQHRERSVSICTDRGPYMTDDYQPSSERERTNSLSSCGTNAERNRRKMSTISRIPTGTGGKIPWCACWGNGCL